jgi:hypothetical protein
MDAEKVLRADDGGVARVEREHNVAAVALGPSKRHFPLDLDSSHLSRTWGQTLSSTGSAVGDLGHEGVVMLFSVCLWFSVVLHIYELASCAGIAHVGGFRGGRPDTVVESGYQCALGPVGTSSGFRCGCPRVVSLTWAASTPTESPTKCSRLQRSAETHDTRSPITCSSGTLPETGGDA